MIKLQRLLKLALGHLLPPEKLNEIEQQASFTVIDDSGSESSVGKKEENYDASEDSV